MAIAPVSIVRGATLGTTLATLYTSPSNITTKAGPVVFTNTSGGTVTFTVQIARAGGTTLPLISARSLAANEAYVSPELLGIVLLTGDAISASASAAGAVNVQGSGATL